MFVAIAIVNGVEWVFPAVEHVADARAKAQAMFAWAKAKGVSLRSVRVVRATPTQVEGHVPAQPAVAAPAKRSRSRKAAGGAA